jgi:hypothetical protein
MSLLPGSIRRDGDGTWIAIGSQRLRFPGEPAGGLRHYLDRPVVIGLRPEHATAGPRLGGSGPGGGGTGAGAEGDGARASSARAGRGGAHRLRLRAVGVAHLGPELLVTCAVDAPAVVVPDAAGDAPPSSAVATLHARFPAHSPVRTGDLVELDVAVTELSFFDPASGAALWHPA